MLSITSKAHYGILAMIDLAQNFGSGLVQIKDIVLRKRIPKNYLEQILNRLQRHGLIKSTRGNKGGYELAQKPGLIQLLEIVEALEGKIGLIDQAGIEVLDEVYKSLEDGIRKALSVSLDEIVRRQEAAAKQIVFHI